VTHQDSSFTVASSRTVTAELVAHSCRITLAGPPVENICLPIVEGFSHLSRRSKGGISSPDVSNFHEPDPPGFVIEVYADRHVEVAQEAGREGRFQVAGVATSES
jgi:hypothetical protein